MEEREAKGETIHAEQLLTPARLKALREFVEGAVRKSSVALPDGDVIMLDTETLEHLVEKIES